MSMQRLKPFGEFLANKKRSEAYDKFYPKDPELRYPYLTKTTKLFLKLLRKSYLGRILSVRDFMDTKLNFDFPGIGNFIALETKKEEREKKKQKRKTQ